MAFAGKRVGGIRSGMGQSRRGNVLVGCLAAVGVILLLLGIALVVAVLNWKNWTAAGLQAVAEEGITELETRGTLPAGEGDEMIAELKVINDAFAEGDVGTEDFFTFYGELFTEGSLVHMTIVFDVELVYLPASGLSDEEKLAGAESLQRLARGLEAGVIGDPDLERVIEPIKSPAPNSSTEIQGMDGEVTTITELAPLEQVTDEQMAEVLAAALEVVDEAGVEEGPYRVDMSDILRAKVAGVLGEASPAEPAGDEADAESEASADEAPAEG